jgi:hypothetical protein
MSTRSAIRRLGVRVAYVVASQLLDVEPILRAVGDPLHRDQALARDDLHHLLAQREVLARLPDRRQPRVEPKSSNVWPDTGSTAVPSSTTISWSPSPRTRKRSRRRARTVA